MKYVNLILVTAVLLSSCATMKAPQEAKAPEKGELSKRQRLLIEGADSVLGKDRLLVRGKEFRIDCTGVIMAIYYYAGIDFTPAMTGYTGNGVTRMYKYLREEELLYTTEYPVPGDIIFWDNTWDANEDGQYNDYLTHIGMVYDVDDSGLITYVHHNYRKGIIIEYMNLTDPDTYQLNKGDRVIIINSPMRMKGAPKAPEGQWLSSHLARVFGKGYLLAR